MCPADKPLLLVDVDGVISLFGFDPAQPPEGRYLMVDGILHLVSASAGGHLRRLTQAFELAWCTGWEEKANEHLPRALHLPGPLPCLRFDGVSRQPDAHWKLSAIDAFAGPKRAVAWIDDAHDQSCHTWALRRAAPTLLVGTDPAVGLTRAQVTALLDWAASPRGQMAVADTE